MCKAKLRGRLWRAPATEDAVHQPGRGLGGRTALLEQGRSARATGFGNEGLCGRMWTGVEVTPDPN